MKFSAHSNPKNHSCRPQKTSFSSSCILARAPFSTKTPKTPRVFWLVSWFGHHLELSTAINHQLELLFEPCFFELPPMVNQVLKETKSCWANIFQGSIIVEHKEDLFQSKSSKQVLCFDFLHNQVKSQLSFFSYPCYAMCSTCISEHCLLWTVYFACLCWKIFDFKVSRSWWLLLNSCHLDCYNENDWWNMYVCC